MQVVVVFTSLICISVMGQNFFRAQTHAKDSCGVLFARVASTDWTDSSFWSAGRVLKGLLVQNVECNGRNKSSSSDM